MPADGVTAAEVAEMQSEAEAQLLDTGRILRHESKSDGAGGVEEGYVPGPELACAIAPISRSSGATTGGNRLDEGSTHVTTWPAATEVSAADRCEVAGVVYSITALREFGALNVTRRVEVKPLGDRT